MLDGELYDGLHDDHVIVVVRPDVIKRKRHHPPYIDCFFDKSPPYQDCLTTSPQVNLRCVNIYIYYFYYLEKAFSFIYV